MSDRKKLAKILLNEAFKLNQGFNKGKPANWLFDMKECMMKPEVIPILVKEIFKKLKLFNSRNIGGPFISANPLTTYILMQSDEYSGFIIRKRPKENGLQKLIEGGLKKGDEVILIDDCINSGGTMMWDIRAMEEAGCIVEGVITIMDFKRGGIERIREAGYKAEAIFDLEDVYIINESLPFKYSVPDELWHIESRAQEAQGLAVSGKDIIFSSDDGINCFRESTKEWKFKAKSPRGLLYHNKIFFSSQGVFYCIDKSGDLIFKEELGEAIISEPCIHRSQVVACASFGVRGGVAASFSDKMEWYFRTQNRISASPVSADDILFIGCESGYLYAIDDGKLLWKKKICNCIKGPLAYDGNVYASSEEGTVYCLDNTGTILWQRKLADCPMNRPTINAGKLFINMQNGRIFVLDKKTGEIDWLYHMFGRSNAPLALDGSRIVCGCADGNIYILDHQKQELVQKINIGEEIISGPVVHEEKMILLTKRRLTCIQKKN